MSLGHFVIVSVVLGAKWFTSFLVSFQEKRKREAGQAKRGKNFVEEEKRIARDYGVYSNFDH